jgi:hypothetical protein
MFGLAAYSSFLKFPADSIIRYVFEVLSILPFRLSQEGSYIPFLFMPSFASGPSASAISPEKMAELET